jgi:hypothetical protein
LIYRFGPKEGRAMKDGLEELSRMVNWAVNNELHVQIKPIHRYTDAQTGEEIIRTTQESFLGWM